MILTFECNFNLSAENFGLFEKSSIHFTRIMVNSMKQNFGTVLRITAIEFSELPCHRVENLHREEIKINRTTISTHCKI